MNDHIFECDQCSRLFDSPGKVRATYEWCKRILNEEELLGTEHLEYEQLVGYVDGILDDQSKQDVEAHIKRCIECRDEMQGLAELKAQIKSETIDQSVTSKRKNPLALMKKPGNRLVVLAAFFILASSLILWIYERRVQVRIASLENTLSQLKQENANLRRQTGTASAKLVDGIAPVLIDGNRYITIGNKGELLGLDGLPAAHRAALRDALTTGRVLVPSLPETSLGRSGSLLGVRPEQKSFEVLYPEATVVEDTRPEFEWQRLAGATSYAVIVRDLTTGAEIESPPVSGTIWKSEKQLARGHQYAWMVEATIDGQHVRAPAPDRPFAAFSILDAQQAQEIRMARESWGSSHLVMGLLYAKAGLIREAEKEFKELVAANPESSTARALLASVQAKTIDGRH